MNILAIIIIAVAIIVVGPILTINALNILFGLGIEVNLYTWLATFWLQTLFVVPKNFSKK